MPLICVGNSHIVAISKGAALAGKSIVEFRLRDMKKSEALPKSALQIEVGKRLVAAVQEHAEKDVFCFCGGNAPVTLGLLQHPERFDFVLPDATELPFDEGADVVPLDAIRSLMGGLLRTHWRLLRHLSQTVPARLVQMEMPPPISDEAFLKKATLKYDPDVATYGISSPHLRYKLWRLHSQMFREFCEKSGIVFVANPPEVFDAEGFLAEPYWGDYVHGNARYGAAIIERLQELRRQ